MAWQGRCIFEYLKSQKKEESSNPEVSFKTTFWGGGNPCSEDLTLKDPAAGKTGGRFQRASVLGSPPVLQLHLQVGLTLLAGVQHHPPRGFLGDPGMNHSQPGDALRSSKFMRPQ